MTHPIPWFIVALVSIPEAFLCLFIGFRLFNIKVANQKIIVIAFLSAIFTYYLRELSLAFGVHTIMTIVFLIAVSRALISTKTLYLSISVASGIIIAGVIQIVTLPLIINAWGIDISGIAKNPWLNFVLFIPVALIMIILGVTIARKNYILYDFTVGN